MGEGIVGMLIALVGGYLSGSIPFGLIVTRLGGAGDVRSIGSGNIGATNVLRTGRKGLAAATLLLDAAKGVVPVLLLGAGSPVLAALAGVGAFLGHCFPVWLKFKGGKGIATFVGVVLAFHWWLLATFALVWLGAAWAMRYSSLAALLATVATSVVAWATQPTAIFGACLAMTAVSFWRHRENIARLRAGTESRIGAK
ncbi:glycerol-3-phosphate 1-O-acyltransferase PlsY [Rhizobiaceae bacterium]|nr:glycerol-3-phosphate 1-O-acyltransferase PlsY [Rhizobiaceae bacterium]